MKVCILSGGKSSRMGEDKGLKLFRGKPLVSYLLNTLSDLKMETFIIAHNEQYEKFGKQVVKDLIPEKGPLGGIYTALNYAGEDVLILSVDSPFLTQQNIKTITQQHVPDEMTIAFSGDKMFPLLAIYPFCMKEKLATLIESEALRLMQFINNNKFKRVDLHLSEIEQLNLNAPDDLLLAEKYFEYEKSIN